jgi:hypothetical protein
MRAWICVALALASCKSADDPARPPAESPSPAAIPVAPAPAAPPDAATLKGHMREHFAAVSELQRAIARGHLDEAKQLADWLGTHDETLLDGWKPYVDDLKASASAVRDAKDLPAAAALAGRLARACSKCHEARSATVAFAWMPAPDDQPTLEPQMKRHQWAAARMWEGLVGPSDELWDQGTRMLAATQLDLVAAGGSGRGDITALARKVNELAKQGAKITDHDERARWYGELLSTCAGCHALARPQPVP